MSFLNLARNVLLRSTIKRSALINTRFVSTTKILFNEEKATKTENVDSTEKAASGENLTEEVKKMLEEKDKKVAEMKDHYLRSLADMENLRQRTQKEVESSKNFAIQKFVKELLGTVDILEMALKSVDESQRSTSKHMSDFYTGVSMTQTELIKTLKRHGVEPINPAGEAFDPNTHQALYQAPCPGKDNETVLSVEKVGYTLNGRVIRPAQVGVVKNN